ncbi:MAG: T9SS type A sorting domain-containing protein [Bacteroidota bacterium]
MYKNICISLLGFFLLQGNILAQCKDSKAFDNPWISCETTNSPNPQRGNSHWISYDFGALYTLEEFQIWNNNKTGELDKGAKEIVVDYSSDGTNWTEAGTYQLSQGDGSAYYSGETVGNLGEVAARYVLITLKTNFGHPSCNSIDEVAFRIKQVALPSNEDLWIYPNPASSFLKVAFDSQRQGTVTSRVINLMGQQVGRQQHEVIQGATELELNVQTFRPGLYVVQVLDEEGVLLGAKKVLISR